MEGGGERDEGAGAGGGWPPGVVVIRVPPDSRKSPRRRHPSRQYCMQIHINVCHVHSTDESDGLRRTSQEPGEARDGTGRPAPRDE